MVTQAIAQAATVDAKLKVVKVADLVATSWRASGNRQISLNAGAERAFANFCDKKHCNLQLQIFATKTSSFTHFCNKKVFLQFFATTE